MKRFLLIPLLVLGLTSSVAQCRPRGWWTLGTVVAVFKSLTFNGTDEYVDGGLAPATDFDGSTAFTISAWLKRSASENYNAIVSRLNFGPSATAITRAVRSTIPVNIAIS
jgi:hypothetical protein